MKVAIFWSLIAVWVLPFVGAAFYVNRERLLSIFGPVLHAFACLYDERARADLRLTIAHNGKIGIAQLALISTQRSLSRSLAIEHKLLEKLHTALAEQEAIEDRCEDSADFASEDQAAASRKKSALIAKKIERRIARTNSLLVATDLRENEVHRIHRSILAESAQKKCSEIISKIDLNVTRNKLQKFEKRVLKAEEIAALRLVPHPDKTVYDAELRALTLRADGMIDSLLERVGMPFQRFRLLMKRLDDRILALDPSLGRAFRRLERARDVVHFLMGQSIAEEESLSCAVETAKESAVGYRQRAENARVREDTEHEQFFKSREQVCLDRVSSFSEELRRLRRRNAVVEDEALRFDVTVRRLFVLKLLMETFPTTLSERFSDYKLVANKLSEVIMDFVHCPTEIDRSVVEDQRLIALETSALAEFLRAAKGEIASDPARLKRRSELVQGLLCAELIEMRSQLDKWKTIRKRTLTDLALLVVSRKIDVLQGFVEHLAHCKEVLSVTVAFIEFKSSEAR